MQCFWVPPPALRFAGSVMLEISNQPAETLQAVLLELCLPSLLDPVVRPVRAQVPRDCTVKPLSVCMRGPTDRAQTC